MSDFYSQYYNSIKCACANMPTQQLENIEKLFLKTHNEKKKLIFCGNGGSAALASHVSVDFTKAAGIRAINFNEPDLITCFANDYGYGHWVEEALRAYAENGDTVVLVSSSGASENIINAAHYCQKKKINLVTLSGFSPNNQLREMGLYNLWVDSKSYNIIEMTHHIWLLAILDHIIARGPRRK